ncbi:MAG: tyrosine--tRNA ligase [Fusobacterium perfoetens]|uniref:tyrosine--tRNA ligase n=1 Tax=Fusobacterium perfoetens TaxID=852 RepID=UPI0023F24FF2|nr:tyrosine--tRNA ligase [Fusobacterium perfoetens]MCI6152202.1 tyrosine--tRNA ligase [Fusobacterium perfoetens]MDY3236528.1 tyrosine--tRNA ligase [Fusobacterium perfoetens]
MNNVYDVLKERGYLKQFTDEEAIKKLLGEEKVTFYIGFDPTADSLHVGHFIAMMFMAHMQKFGHRPIALIGGGTAMIGDPSGRTDMRQMMTKETIAHNVSCIKKQMEKFIDFTDGKAILANNGDWLLDLNYIEFIRDIGSLFSVNRMLSAECFKTRMENGGLSFLEFNYMLMQGYDFYVLNQKYNCKMQLGGDDQWSNIIAGINIIRKKKQEEAYGMTCTLLTNSEGKKMGKTAKGALWLDPKKTTPYEFYQYWRNIDDADVEKCLSLLTFIPMDEVKRLSSLKDAEINKAKVVLAYEITKMIHGEDEAEKAKLASEALFGSGNNMENVPTKEITEEQLGVELTEFLSVNKVLKNKSEGRRLIEQNGMSVNDEKITDVKFMITKDLFEEKEYIIVKMGKKRFLKIVLK